MSATLALGGWVAALGAATAGRIVLGRRMELVARAAHELRGPLTAARLALHAVARRPGVPRDQLRAIDRELDRARLALADLAAVQEGRRTAGVQETFELGGLLAELAQVSRAAAWAAGGRLTFEPLGVRVLVRGDRPRLGQAIRNLLDNAIEHGGGEVRLRARAGVHSVRIEVLDEGDGLPAPVPLLVRRPRGRRGTRGHGLSIVADIAARHGGRLASAPAERGARLVIELPTAPPSVR